MSFTFHLIRIQNSRKVNATVYLKSFMKIAFYLTTLLIISLLGVFMTGCSAFGTRPGKEYDDKFKTSTHYNPEEKVFVNRRQDLLKEMRKKRHEFFNF